jgi:hypothetical protein
VFDFGPDFFEWWAGLNPLVRYAVAAVLLVVGAALCYFAEGGYLVWGSYLAVGCVLLLFAGRSPGE